MDLFQLDDYEVKTIVYFVGDCEFKTPMPINVLNTGIVRFIKSFDEVLLTEDDVTELYFNVKDYISDNRISKKDHLESLVARHNSKTRCPRCGSNLVLRVSKKGINYGEEFLGCKSFPKCRFTTNEF